MRGGKCYYLEGQNRHWRTVGYVYLNWISMESEIKKRKKIGFIYVKKMPILNKEKRGNKLPFIPIRFNIFNQQTNLTLRNLISGLSIA